jgi:YD repeat-containing protein
MKSILVAAAMSILLSAFGQSAAPVNAGPVFDQGGHQTAYVYPDGKQDSYKYDAQGRMTHFIDRIGQVTVFEYSANGTLLSVTRPNGFRDAGIDR